MMMFSHSSPGSLSSRTEAKPTNKQQDDQRDEVGEWCSQAFGVVGGDERQLTDIIGETVELCS